MAGHRKVAAASALLMLRCRCVSNQFSLFQIIGCMNWGSTLPRSMRRRAEPREWAFQSYIPRHGGAPIAVVEIGVTLTDARDHREYYYAQFVASEKAMPLRREGSLAAEISEGPASTEPLRINTALAAAHTAAERFFGARTRHRQDDISRSSWSRQAK